MSHLLTRRAKVFKNWKRFSMIYFQLKFFGKRFSMQKVVELFRGMPGVSLRLSFYRTRDLSHPKRELYHYCVSLDEINHIPEIALIDCLTEKNCQYICKTGEI